MNPVRLSLRYPQVTLVLAAMMFLVGVSALIWMPRREDPKITIREGLIVATYPGATAEQVEDRVTRKIEEHLFHFEEVRRAKTYSTTRNGMVTVNVRLNESVQNADQFWSKLRLEMAQLRQTELPDGVRGPIVDSDFGDTVAVLIAIHGNGYGSRELTDYAKTVEDRLRVLPAVSKIHRIGEEQEEIDVATDSARLAQFGVNPQRVVQALAGRNAVEYAGGVPAGKNKVPIMASGTLSTEDEIRHALVVGAPDGKPLHVGDLAEVRRGYADPTQYVRIGGEPAVLLSVEMHEGNNIVFFGRALHKALDALGPQLPPGIKLDMVADQPRVVSERVLGFFREFGIAIVAVILVTMLLLPMRVALVAAVAIPVTVMATFGLLDMVGVELQQVSIAALIVVLGMVVDDAIVIADNYVELLDRGLPREEAAWRSASEMAVPVLTATLTIIASFAPMLLLTSSVGEFIRALPIAVTIALATSFIVAMLLTPMTARLFIQQGLVDHESKEQEEQKKFTMLGWMQAEYNRLIGYAMRHKRATLMSGVAVFLLGVIALRFVPQQFFPLAERNQFVIDVWLPEGARIEATDAAVRKIEAVLKGDPLVAMTTSFLGASAPRFYYNVNPQPPAANYAQILVNTSSEKKTPALVARLRTRLAAAVPEAQSYVKELQQGEELEAPVEVRLVGDDAQQLRVLGDHVEDILRHTPGAIYTNSDWHEDEWQVRVAAREEVANRLGFTDANLAQQLGGAFEGAPVTTYWEGDRAVNVAFRLDEADRQTTGDLASTYVISPTTGARVPLNAVATLEPGWQPGRIVHRNGVRTLTVRAFPSGGRLASEILADIRKQVDVMPLPPGYRVEYGGEFENQNETSGELVMALGVSLVLIFLILLFQFRSFLDPLIVMTAFPLALPGAAFGLLVTRNTFGFTAFIGIVSLGGLVVRNSIILIDYIHVRMREGVALEDAALEAGERRLRPIFLTTMAAAIGVLPMILSGSSLWSPLASAIAFGLLGSMFFTLVMIPVLFVAVHARWGWMRAAKATAAVLLLTVCVCRVQAETRPMTLDEATAMAAHNNPTVRMARLHVKEMEARVGQARADYFPSVTNSSMAAHAGKTEDLVLPAGVLGTYPSAGPIPGKNISVKLGNQNFLLSTTTAAQPLTQLFKIHAGVAAAHAEAATARADERRAETEVGFAVRKLYLNLLTAQKKRSAAVLNIEAAQMQQAEAERGVEAGVALELKSLEAKAQQAETRHQLGALDDAIADLQQELDHQLGLPLDTQLELAEPKLEVEPSAAAELESVALEHNPQVAVARAALAKSRAGVAAARAEFIPNIAAYGQHVYQTGVPLLSENNAIVGLRVDWTIFDLGKRTGQVRERLAQRSQAEINLADVENQVRVEIEKQARKLARTETELAAARDGVAARREMRRIVADEVTARTANPSVLKDAEAKLAAAEASLFASEAQRAVDAADLARIAGD